jgi:hypothetical protein
MRDRWRELVNEPLEIGEWVRYVPPPRRLGTNRFGIENYGRLGRVVGFSSNEAPVILLLTLEGRLERSFVTGADLERARPTPEEESEYLIATLEV